MKILNTDGLTSAISDMIKNEKNCLLLITPFIDLEPRQIEDMKSSNSKIRIVIRKEWRENKKEEYREKIKRLKEELPKIDFIETDNLHAKVYLSSNKIIITSMNLYSYSQQNNFELGVIFDYDKNSKICEDVVKEIKTFLINNKRNEIEKLFNELYPNHCIVCGEFIENENHKYCKECYNKQITGGKYGKT